MNKPAGFFSECYGQRPGHNVCAGFQPQERLRHMELLLTVPRHLDKLPAKRLQGNKQPIITPSNHRITSCLLVIQKSQSPWLPCCQETVRVGRVDVSEMTELDRGTVLVKSGELSGKKYPISLVSPHSGLG
ncbi:unnamed protein product [Pleuronectes platessa]|uniref:Uncharacterized protein n=1 Tax=Pleuronectes platessa TaxID=8262 RepID=A0A9N7UUT6_PLEPL|nr:unnamed protein product [Pleuronectes platessa]